jgi:hypothetical protein
LFNTPLSEALSSCGPAKRIRHQERPASRRSDDPSCALGSRPRRRLIICSGPFCGLDLAGFHVQIRRKQLARCGTTTSAIQSNTRRYSRLTSARTTSLRRSRYRLCGSGTGLVSGPSPSMIRLRSCSLAKKGRSAGHSPRPQWALAEAQHRKHPARRSSASHARRALRQAAAAVEAASAGARPLRLVPLTDVREVGHRKHSIADFDAVAGRLRREALADDDVARTEVRALTARNSLPARSFPVFTDSISC